MIPLQQTKLVSHINENWSANRGKFGSMDLLELTFFTCDKYLLSGVTLRPSYRRSIEDLSIKSEDAAKHYQLQMHEANLYARKSTVTDHVLSAIESTLLETPANYPYQREFT